MSRYFTLAALGALLSVSQFARAHDDDKQNVAKEGPKAVVIGAARISDSAAAPTDKANEPTPEFGVRHLIVTSAASSPTNSKEAQAAFTISSPTTLTLTIVKDDGSFRISAGSLSFGSAAAAPAEVRVRATRIGKVIAIGPDGKPTELEVKENDVPAAVWAVLPGDVRKLIALPPKAEFPPVVQQALQSATRAMDAQALQAEKERELATAHAAAAQAMAKLKAAEAEAINARTEEAAAKYADAMNAKTKAQMDAYAGALAKAMRQQSGVQSPDSQTVSAKLDKILERLDHLEKEVEMNKAKRAN